MDKYDDCQQVDKDSNQRPNISPHVATNLARYHRIGVKEGDDQSNKDKDSCFAVGKNE